MSWCIHVLSSNLKPLVSGQKNSVRWLMISDIICHSFLIPGTSIFNGIEDLANKESNRILEMKEILKKLMLTANINLIN